MWRSVCRAGPPSARPPFCSARLVDIISGRCDGLRFRTAYQIVQTLISGRCGIQYSEHGRHPSRRRELVSSPAAGSCSCRFMQRTCPSLKSDHKCSTDFHSAAKAQQPSMCVGPMIIDRSVIHTVEGVSSSEQPADTAAYSKASRLADGGTGKEPERKFRPPGSKAGTWPHTTWEHCTLHDPYERVNVWSHGVPGVLLFALAILAPVLIPDAAQPLALFGVCSGLTHMLSMLTHIWPDSHGLEKLDHLGIVATIIGNPMSSLMAIEHGHIPIGMKIVTGVMLCAAFLPPLFRVLGFFGGVMFTVTWYGREIFTPNLGFQLILFGIAAVSFLRNSGHSRGPGCSDHHILHYVVSAASVLQIYNLVQLCKLND